METATAAPMPPPMAAPLDDDDLTTGAGVGVADGVLVAVDEVDVADEGAEVGTKPGVCTRIVGLADAVAPTPVKTTLFVCYNRDINGSINRCIIDRQTHSRRA